MNRNYFQGTAQYPHHISIGAVVRNNEGKICCHYFDTFTHKSFGTFTDFYLLMRETIEPNETIESCLARGLMEEFGIKAELNRYIGSIVSKFEIEDTNIFVEKTTLYFICDFISIDELLRKKDDPEASSKIEWQEPAYLISKMKDQGERLKREDIDESAILKKLAKVQ